MADNSMKDWKKPIALSDYVEFTAKPIAVEKGKQHFFETKDSTSYTGHSLRARIRMTFAGLATKNDALYLPDEMFKGARTWTTPFAKPVLKHHNDLSDPIGRVIDVRYVDTTNQAVQLDARAADLMRVFRDKAAKPKRRLQTVPLFLELQDAYEDYRGVGHIEGLWDIADPDSIKKILDGRLFTVSTSFMPEGAYCSSCAQEGELTDWRHDYCDHNRGDMVDGVRCVAVPHGFDYSEGSFVNDPAAEYAQLLEFGEGLDFADAHSKVRMPIPYSLITDAVLVKGEKAFRFSDSAQVEIPQALADLASSNTSTEKDASVIGENEHREENPSQGKDMKFAQLIQDTNSNYEAIVEFLPEDASRLTGVLLADLDDSVFIGPNRTFPVKDLAHAEAIKALMEKVEDSDPRTSLLEILGAKLEALRGPAEEPEAPAEEEVAVEGTETDSETETPEIDKLLADNGLAKITIEALEALREAAEKALDLSISRDMFQKRTKSLETDVAALEAQNTELLRDHKKVLAEQLVDAQVAGGKNIEDKAKAVTDYCVRNLDSLKDSLADWSAKREVGMANTPSGELVDLGGNAEDSASETKETDLTQYAEIIENYWDKFYGPGGNREADAWLARQKRDGYLPAGINP